jgi:putative protease
MKTETEISLPPLILAPAGSKTSFLAALAAGADAIYCGLKTFSARSEAKNFTLEELAPLTRLARNKGVKVNVAFNSLLTPDDLDPAGRLLEQLARWVKPDAIIIQDLSLIQLARQAGFSGGLHLSTLSNVSFPAALKLVRKTLGVDRIVIPRELNIDEIKAMALACPKDLDLEVFIHGALCYGISGRCYWSSYLGGKSGLRGRCVQPCRRVYTQKGQNERFFSCQDLSLDVLVKVLMPISKVRAWKIEGRKKGPHYVYYTVKAYQILRDQGTDPEMKRTALALLSHALGRPGTHYNFLPQRPQNPVNINAQTGSGLLVGRVKGSRAKPFLTPREELLTGDILRLGYEDDPWHEINKVNTYIPKKGRFYLKPSKKRSPKKGTPIFLTGRREKALEDRLSKLDGELIQTQKMKLSPSKFIARLPKKIKIKAKVIDLNVFRRLGKAKYRGQTGLWLSSQAIKKLPKGLKPRVWWWLPPAVWPEEEKKLQALVDLTQKQGGRNFVLNAPWQTAFFRNTKGVNLWAGPFCNISNALSKNCLVSLGFTGVIVSPELGREDYLKLPKQSPLPLGIVISGNWPLCISRVLSDHLKPWEPFASPKGEEAWAEKYGSEYWVYPNWQLDIRGKKKVLEKAGYRLFVHLFEPLPKGVQLKKRPGMWNWNLNLL